MTTQKIYQLPVEVTNWKFDGATEIAFNWEYDAGSSDLLNLYEKGKQQQWDTSTRLDWSQELFEGNPMGMADEIHPDLRLAVLGQDDREGARLAALQPAVPFDLPVHARRAGRADRHRQDRQHRARHRTPSSTPPPR